MNRAGGVEETIENRDSGTQVACVIAGYRREVDENCALLRCYAASSFNFLPTFRGQPIWPISRGQESKRIYLNWILDPPEDGTDGLSRNVGKKLPLLAA